MRHTQKKNGRIRKLRTRAIFQMISFLKLVTFKPFYKQKAIVTLSLGHPVHKGPH